MRKGSKHTEAAMERMRLIKLGKKPSLETRAKLSLARLGNKNTLGHKLTEEHKKKIGLMSSKTPRTKEWCQKISIAHQGKRLSEEHRRKISGMNASNWKGGTTPINKLLRRSREFIEWRKAVFQRDNWICQECKQRGGELHPDHIKPFAFFPELRFELSNGRTLCKECHIKTDSWGGRGNKNYYGSNHQQI